MTRAITGLREVAADFDAFLVDVWGVLHDGSKPFPPVLETLAVLPRVILLTNTSRLGPAVVDALGEMGIRRELFEDAVTAGDVTRAALVARDPAVFAVLPPAPRCYHFGSVAFVPWLFELGFDFIDDVAAADLVFATGAVPDRETLDAAIAELAPAAARNVPLVCTNPDRFVPTAAGMRFGPGAVAQGYAALGAPVFMYGKPHRPIYDEARRRLGPAARILALGDTLETDIRGARDAGITSMLVTETGVDRHHEAGDVTPDYVIPAFAW